MGFPGSLGQPCGLALSMAPPWEGLQSGVRQERCSHFESQMYHLKAVLPLATFSL